MKLIQNLFQRMVVNSFAMALLIGIVIPSALADAGIPCREYFDEFRGCVQQGLAL